MNVLVGVSKSLKFVIADTTEQLTVANDLNKVDTLFIDGLSRMTTLVTMFSLGVKGDNTRVYISAKGDGLYEMISGKTTRKKGIATNIKLNDKIYEKVKKHLENEEYLEAVNMSNIGNGLLNIQVDLNMKKPYTSTVEIENGNLEKAFETFYEKSEQVKSIINTSTSIDDNMNIKSSGGFLIQLLPGGDELIFNKMAKKIKRIYSIASMLENGFDLYKIAEILFEDDEKMIDTDEKIFIENYEILDKKHIIYECDCSYENTVILLKNSFTKKEIEELKDDEKLEAVCGFCSRKYMIGRDDLIGD